MAKYQSRFENFFLNLRLNRAEFGEMAAFTLHALRESPQATTYAPLIADLATAVQNYTNSHSGQLSGAGKSATATVGQALLDFKAYVRRVERKYVIPNYDAGSAELLAIFPKGRSWLTNRPQYEVLDAFTAFLKAISSREEVFPVAVRKEGSALHLTLSAALQLAAGTAANTSTQRNDLHDGREAVCQQLFRIYATLLLEHYLKPERVAGFFDLSRAFVGSKKAKLVMLALPA